MTDYMADTPYLLTDDPEVLNNFDRLLRKAESARELAGRAAVKIESDAKDIFGQFRQEIRSDLVSESNKIEGYIWSSKDVSATVREYRELLNQPVREFMTGLRGDPRVYEALGLYRAYALADEWANEKRRPRQSEIRELHQLIIGNETHAGGYKLHPNRIGGSEHTPPEPFQVPQDMQALSDWWSKGTGITVLDAAIVHAWITHIHPFEDGNGRMARVLANLTLVQDGYPPFLLRDASDRNQYYDALARSDSGELLPLFDLFVKVLRRTSKQMCRDNYARNRIRGTLLSDSRKRYDHWSEQVELLFDKINQDVSSSKISMKYQGVPAIDSFVELQELDSAGNSWAAIFDLGNSACLLWFGYVSDSLRGILNLNIDADRYPSLFLSVKSQKGDSVHPFVSRINSSDGLLNEIYISPLTSMPVDIRTGHDVRDYSISEAAREIGDSIRTALVKEL
ncbi:Fic family protein [Rhodococcus sp. 06-1460-1B]|uniref:Fic family protein n=1 Tax=Rhodococcus sp. 06-1460-1B TaxID=2022501 RepID=UPI000B9ABE81|nr:Fic family protein [Rhodococcus sp. 06-1460-1B]OZD53574.1 hypothetical protein CH268_27165 [Rhodococcus sp. 06-1460-1B]